MAKKKAGFNTIKKIIKPTVVENVEIPKKNADLEKEIVERLLRLKVRSMNSDDDIHNAAIDVCITAVKLVCIK